MSKFKSILYVTVQTILTARSAYFARMFGSGLAESYQEEISIPEVGATVML